MSINDIAYHLQNKVIRDATTAAKILHTQVDPGFMRGITWCERTPNGDYFPTYFGYLFAKNNVVICVEDISATKGWDHIPWAKVFENFDKALEMVGTLPENVRHVVLFKENEKPVIVPLGDYDGDI